MQMTVHLAAGSTVLFIGDSVTDCGRDRADPGSLGDGFPALVAADFARAHPDAGIRFVNRGISGNRAADLRERWERDCLRLEPDVVSILIGINEVWRRYDSEDPTPTEVFEDNYRNILKRAAEQGPQLIMMEPFLLPVRADQLEWREDLDPKLAAVRGLAAEFDATLIATDGLLTRAAATDGPGTLAADGVHPTPAGHALLAQAWLATAGAPV
jgi:lysophospholipase L1-like esterase